MFRNTLVGVAMVGCALVASGCSGGPGTGEATGTTAAADTCPTCGGQTVTLKGIDERTLVIRAIAADGSVVKLQYSRSTENVAANLNEWPPDPIRAFESAQDWNQQLARVHDRDQFRDLVQRIEDLTDDKTGATVTTSAVTNGAADILSFQPVPAPSN